MIELNRQTKTFIAIFTLVASTLYVIGNVVARDPIENWATAGILFLISMVFWAWLLSESEEAEEETAALAVADGDAETLPQAQEWIISKELITEIEQEAAAQEAVVADEPIGVDAVIPDEVEDAAPNLAEETVTEVPIPEVEEAAPEMGEVLESEEAAPTVAEEPEPVAEEPLIEDVVEVPPVPVEVIEEELVVEKEPAPVAEAAADEDEKEPDDLTRIEGIGPKYSDALIEAGVITFAQIADMTQAQFEEIASEAGMRRAASMETWAEQAKLAAANEWDALDQLQSELSGGRRDD
jgi:predicted flap endonuclease-1-like 5' DNA nuclease